MNIILVVVSLVFFISGVYINLKDNKNPENLNSWIENSPSSTPFPTGSEKPIFSPSAVVKGSVSSTTVPEASKPASDILGSFQYPRSNIISKTESEMVLENSGQENIVTNWYKNKIESQRYSSKSYALTNTNGNILNKLSAAKNGSKVEIEIKKDSSESKIHIIIRLTN